MPIFKNRKQHSIFFPLFFSLFIFAVLFFVFLPKAYAEVLFSQNGIDTSISNTDLPNAINDPWGGMFAYPGEYGAVLATVTTTIEKIGIYVKFEPEIDASHCTVIRLEDVIASSTQAWNFFNKTANLLGYCEATTSPAVVYFDIANGETAVIKTGHLYSLSFDNFANETTITWYGTSIGSSTYPNFNWAGYAKDANNGYPLIFSDQAIPLRPEINLFRFSFAVMSSEYDVWSPNFETPPEIACESWDFGGLGIGLEICKALSFLFLPDFEHLQKFSQLGDTLATKPPFGYFNSVKSNLANLNTSSTPAFVFADMGDIKTHIFDPLRTGLAWILWILFAFFVIKRIGVFDF
jgi:hypothetical protein